MANYATTRNTSALFDLLKEIKAHTFKLTNRDYPYQSIWDSYTNVFTMRQGKNEFLDRFQERFNVLIEAAEGYGCRFGSEEVLWNTDQMWKTLTEDQKKDETNRVEVQERCRERLLAYGFTSAFSDCFDIYKKRFESKLFPRK